MDATWTFDQPPRCAVFTTRGVLEDDKPVLYVSHDEDDESWQFLDGDTPDVADARIVALHEILDLDQTLAELADLPVGWHAWREFVGGRWSRAQNSEHDA